MRNAKVPEVVLNGGGERYVTRTCGGAAPVSFIAEAARAAKFAWLCSCNVSSDACELPKVSSSLLKVNASKLCSTGPTTVTAQALDVSNTLLGFATQRIWQITESSARNDELLVGLACVSKHHRAKGMNGAIMVSRLERAVLAASAPLDATLDWKLNCASTGASPQMAVSKNSVFTLPAGSLPAEEPCELIVVASMSGSCHGKASVTVQAAAAP